MLTPEFLETAANPISGLMYGVENWALQDIAQRISKTGRLTASAEHQLLRLADMRQFDNDFKTHLARLTGLTNKEIDRLFAEAAANAHNYDKRLFEAKGIPFIPFNENPFLQQLVAGISKQTKDEFVNLTQSMGFLDPYGNHLPPKAFYTHTLDDITMQVSTGVTSYDEAIKRAVGRMVDNGITVVNYASGHNDRIEVAVRRAVLTGVSQISDKVAFRNVEELGAEYVEVSLHNGARTGAGVANHQNWQGGVYKLNGFKI